MVPPTHSGGERGRKGLHQPSHSRAQFLPKCLPVIYVQSTLQKIQREIHNAKQEAKMERHFITNVEVGEEVGG